MDESTFKQEDFSVEGQPPASQQVRGRRESPNEEVRIGPGGLGWVQGQYVGF